MVGVRSFVLPIALAGSACAGSPFESASGAASDAADDDDDLDDGASGTDPTIDPESDGGPDDTTDASAETTASVDPDGGASTSDSVDDSTLSDDGSSGSSGGTTNVDCHPQLDELAIDVDHHDDTFEWIALHNPCEDAIDLAGYALGWAGTDYTYGTLALRGVIEPGGCFVVGGPDTNGTNYDPALDLAADFVPDLQNAGSNDADAVGLFQGGADEITPTSVPIDAVVYGTENIHGLVDETGATAAVDVEPGTDLDTIARLPDGSWVVNPSPSPNDCASPAR